MKKSQDVNILSTGICAFMRPAAENGCSDDVDVND